MNTTQNSDDMENFPSLGEALAEVDSEVVFREAQRQFATLTTKQQGQSVDLVAYYQSLFDQATAGWDNTKKQRLLSICFAYKTKARVLEFLDLLSGTEEWVPHFEHLVKNHGVDSAFDAPEELTLPSTSSSSEMCHPGATSSRPHPYFVIPTLALAYPTEFFGALVTMAPLRCLKNVSSIYRYPAAPLLAVNLAVEGRIGEELGKFVHRNVEADADHPAVRPWADFFNHLFEYDTLLWPVGSTKYGNRLNIETFMEAAQEGGFDDVDLEMWLASWKAERQKGKKRKAKAKAKTKSTTSRDKHANGNLVKKCAGAKQDKKVHRSRPCEKGAKRVRMKLDWGRGRPLKKPDWREERYIWYGLSSSERADSPSGSEISDEDSEMEDLEA